MRRNDEKLDGASKTKPPKVEPRRYARTFFCITIVIVICDPLARLILHFYS